MSDPDWCWVNDRIIDLPPPPPAPLPLPPQAKRPWKGRRVQDPGPSADPAPAGSPPSAGSGSCAGSGSASGTHHHQPTQPDHPPLGYKGCGVKGSYGVAVDAPCVVLPPAAAGQPLISSSQSAASATLAIGVTATEVEEWLSEYSPFQNQNEWPPLVGQEVLWRGLKIGPSGGASTAKEYFNGTVHHLKIDPDTNDTFFYVT